MDNHESDKDFNTTPFIPLVRPYDAPTGTVWCMPPGEAPVKLEMPEVCYHPIHSTISFRLQIWSKIHATKVMYGNKDTSQISTHGNTVRPDFMLHDIGPDPPPPRQRAQGPRRRSRGER